MSMRDTSTPATVLAFFKVHLRNIDPPNACLMLDAAIENLALEFESEANYCDRKKSEVKVYAPPSAIQHWESRAKAFRVAAQALRRPTHLPSEFKPL